MDFSGWDHDQMKDYIRKFKLGDCARGDQGYNRVLLQLFGYAGHGKSSFINSCKFVLDGEYRIIAEAGDKQEGFTMDRRSYELTDTVTVVDNRGFGIMTSFEVLEVYAQLGNFRPLDRVIDQKEEYTDLMGQIEDNDMDPNYTDLIVPILVYSARDHIPKQEESKMEAVLETCGDMTGIFPFVVLTNKNSDDYITTEKMFKRFGVEAVFAVENYTEKSHLEKRGRHMDILHILCHALKDVTFHMEKERNPKQERIECKKFLLEMIHKSVLDKEKVSREEPNNSKKPDDRGWLQRLFDSIFGRS